MGVQSLRAASRRPAPVLPDPVLLPAREKAEPGKVPAFSHTAQHLQ